MPWTSPDVVLAPVPDGPRAEVGLRLAQGVLTTWEEPDRLEALVALVALPVEELAARLAPAVQHHLLG